MPSVSPLGSPPLGELLDDIATGKLQLPDFQREWKWDDDRVRSLLATLTLNYPMGVAMSLHTGGGVRFKARTLAGAESARDVAPERLLLDGQQRLTSLYQALRSGRPVQTTDGARSPLRRWYYIDIKAALDSAGDREEAIWSVPENRIVPGDFGRGVRHDLTTPDNERAAGFFPLRLALDSDATLAWMFKYAVDSTTQEIWTAFKARVLDNITGYQVPVINLGKETPKEAVCIVFEKVNTQGVQLNVFELLTASYAGDTDYFNAHGEDFQLREDWERVKGRLESEYPVLAKLESTDFLQAVALVSTYHRRKLHLDSGGDRKSAPAVGAKRRDILDLPLAEYETWAPRVADALAWAATFLSRQGVFRANDVPYKMQLVPLAAIRTILGDRIDQRDVEPGITRWYWCGVLGELYSGTTETRIANDVAQVVEWVESGLPSGNPPGTIKEATFREGRLPDLSTRNSAAYKGVYALILRQGCRDWYFNNDDIDAAIAEGQQVEIHEIFPKASGREAKALADKLKSVINKTPMSSRTSRTVASHRPSVYLSALERESGLPPQWLDDVIVTHLIDPKHLRTDDFDAFYAARRIELTRLIEQAMGRPVIPDGSDGASDAS